MGYRVKWVEEHLGVSRKALRLFEKAGLMPENKNGQYREYSDEDIEQIWNIRVLQGMGFTLKEIVTMASDPDCDVHEVLGKKVLELEIKRTEIERHLGYAKMIKLTGRFPHRPKELGTMRWEEFQQRAVKDWNVHSNPQTEVASEMVEHSLLHPMDMTDPSNMSLAIDYLSKFDLSTKQIEFAFSTIAFVEAIGRRIALGPNHPEVQLLIKILFDDSRKLFESMSDATPAQFGRIASSGFVVGDISVLLQNILGKEVCLFIADAIAIFGGYKNFEDST